MKQEKNILIISVSSGGLSSTRDYFFGQSWSVTCEHSLKEALHTLVTDHPDVVLICMDHLNKNIQRLPQLILERIQCCVIATSEKSTVENYRHLQKANCEYKLFPPNAGPAVLKVYEKYIQNLNKTIDVRGTYENKRSGISPKSFKNNIAKENIFELLEYSNFEGSSKSKIPQLMIQGTENLISDIIENENSDYTDSTVVYPLKMTSQITCMLIDCAQFQGYLVAAMGSDCHLDAKFNVIICKHLREFLKKQGEAAVELDSFNVIIKPVAFLDWAADYANFLRQSIYKQNEIAFTFFPKSEVRTNYRVSDTDGMVRVPIVDLYGEALVAFNLYIFFPANKKYVLYTSADSIFYNYQKERLIGRGIEVLYIRQEDLSKLNQYRAQKYFNTIVEEYTVRTDMPA